MKSLAEKDLAGASDHTDQLKLGDAWWDAAQKNDETTKEMIQGRAAYWYRQALPRLTGLLKDRVEKRLPASKSLPHPARAMNGSGSERTSSRLTISVCDRL